MITALPKKADSPPVLLLSEGVADSSLRDVVLLFPLNASYCYSLSISLPCSPSPKAIVVSSLFPLLSGIATGLGLFRINYADLSMTSVSECTSIPSVGLLNSDREMRPKINCPTFPHRISPSLPHD